MLSHQELRVRIKSDYFENLYLFIPDLQLFRHGDRTPSKKETYPKLPTNHIYETLGYGQLTEVNRLYVSLIYLLKQFFIQAKDPIYFQANR